MMSLKDAKEGVEYTIREITTDDEELKSFLFSLGCYSGESVTVISHKRKNHVISIKDGRYNIDGYLAEAIMV
ncbi:MAG: FeoA family protein [Emergencia sp.]